jgi:hypothetical protein
MRVELPVGNNVQIHPCLETTPPLVVLVLVMRDLHVLTKIGPASTSGLMQTLTHFPVHSKAMMRAGGPSLLRIHLVKILHAGIALMPILVTHSTVLVMVLVMVLAMIPMSAGKNVMRAAAGI